MRRKRHTGTPHFEVSRAALPPKDKFCRKELVRLTTFLRKLATQSRQGSIDASVSLAFLFIVLNLFVVVWFLRVSAFNFASFSM